MSSFTECHRHIEQTCLEDGTLGKSCPSNFLLGHHQVAPG